MQNVTYLQIVTTVRDFMVVMLPQILVRFPASQSSFQRAERNDLSHFLLHFNLKEET